METKSKTLCSSTTREIEIAFPNFHTLFNKFFNSVNHYESHETIFPGVSAKDENDFSFMLLPQLTHEGRSLCVQMTYAPNDDLPPSFLAHFLISLRGNNGEYYEQIYIESITSTDGQIIEWNNFISQTELDGLFFPDPVIKNILFMKVDIRIFLKKKTIDYFPSLEPALQHSITQRRKLLCDDIQNFKDCTLVIKGIEIKVNKLILSSNSPVFETMFRNNMIEKHTGRVEIDCQDIAPNTVRTLVHFLNKRKCPILEITCELLLLADKYQIDTLIGICEKSLSLNIPIDKICLYYSWADLVNLPSLKQACVSAFCRNYSTAINSTGWTELKTTMPSVAYRLCENVEDYRVYPIDAHQHKKCRREPNSNLLPESTLMNPSNWGTSMADEKAFYAQNAPPLHPLRAKSFDVSMQNPRNCSSIQGPAGNIKAEHSCTIQHLFTHPDYFNGYQSSDFGFLEDIEQVRCRLWVLPHGRMADYNDPSKHVVIELVVDVAEEDLRHIMKCTVKPGNLPSESQTEIIEQQKVLFAFDELFSRDDWLMDPETDHEFTIHISVTVISTKFVKGKGDTRFGPLLDTMESLCKSGESGDIIVCYGDVKFFAHKHVLCARSAKIASFLALSNVNANELVLETKEKCELHPTAVRDLMFYIYTGQYPKRAGRNSCLKSLATFFKLDYLHNDCEAIEPNPCTQSFKMKSHLPEEFDKLFKEIVNFP